MPSSSFALPIQLLRRWSPAGKYSTSAAPMRKSAASLGSWNLIQTVSAAVQAGVGVKLLSCTVAPSIDFSLPAVGPSGASSNRTSSIRDGNSSSKVPSTRASFFEPTEGGFSPERSRMRPGLRMRAPDRRRGAGPFGGASSDAPVSSVAAVSWKRPLTPSGAMVRSQASMRRIVKSDSMALKVIRRSCDTRSITATIGP